MSFLRHDKKCWSAIHWPLSQQVTLSIGVCLAVASCGPPKAPDIRAQWSENIQQLGGLTAVYPPREAMRIGQLWIADASAASDVARSGVKPRHLTGMRLSDGAAPEMEQMRQKQFPIVNRFPRSGSTLAQDLGIGGGGRMLKQPEGDTLEISSLPSYELASLSQLTLGASAPTALASFFGSSSVGKTNSLTVEAVGVEIAEVPFADFQNVVRDACSDPRTTLGDAGKRQSAQYAAYKVLETWHTRRQIDAGNAELAPYSPLVFLIRRVFYMRGINYIFHDSSVAAAALSAAFNTRLPAGTTPPAVQPVPAAAPAAAPTTKSQPSADDLKSAIADITAIKTALAAGNNVNVGGSAAHATARGVEMTLAFERPMAFGYDAVVSSPIRIDGNGQVSGGIEDLCHTFR